MFNRTRVRIFRITMYSFLLSILAITSYVAWNIFSSASTPQLLFLLLVALSILTLLSIFIFKALDNKLLVLLQQSEQQSDALFAMLYQNSPVAYITLNKTGIIVNYNAVTLQLTNTEDDELMQQPFTTLFAADFDASLVLSKIRTGLTINKLEAPLYSKSGSKIWVLLSAYTLPHRGEHVVSMLDITEQKRVDTAKSEFVALATHQLRTPVAAIRFATELLTKHINDGPSERNHNYLAKIDRNVKRMLALINDFLNVSKLEMGTFATATETITIKSFIDDTLDAFTEKIADKQLAVDRQDNHPEQELTTDPRLLNIVANNLISNAIKYTPAGGTVTIASTVANNMMQITIQDSGIGIPSAELDQLFNKFFRASNARQQQTEGTGLGLYIIQQAVEQLSGTIDVESKENQGTTFTVTVPLVMG